MSLFEKLVDKKGVQNISPKTKAGRLLKGRGVPRSNELRRIYNIERRTWAENDLIELAEKMTQLLKAPGGAMKLWPLQAAALYEMGVYGGVFGPIAVGKGKALISLLAPVVMDAERPILLVPAQLREQTNRQVIPDMLKHWVLHDNLNVVGYSELSLAKNHDLLSRLSPDLIVLDEAHSVKNDKAARSRRLRRYLKDAPGTRVVALSGTMTRRSLMDYWRLLGWTLKDVAPIPDTWREVQTWACALDDDVDETARVAPGALLDFCEDGETDIRAGYRRRLISTPGVIASGEEELGVALRVLPVQLAMPAEVRAALRKLETTWATPNGDPITQALDIWRHSRELVQGFWLRWDPPPPRDWMFARQGWKLYVRTVLSNNARGLDSELQVWNECEREEVAGALKDGHPFFAWRAIRDKYKINSVPEWISDYAISYAVDWLKENEGIVWTENPCFGEGLAAIAGVPYYGSGTKASRDILGAQGPIVVSIAAHSEGKNLQRYRKNLVVSPPSSGKRWEQLLGRTHRAGQKADEVAVEVFYFADCHFSALQAAVDEAKYISETLGAMQKLLYCDLALPKVRR